METSRIKTGQIMPRDYGITLSMPRGLWLFVSPLKYAIGELLLETRAEIRSRIYEKANREGIPAESLLEEFVDAVEKKEGSKNILNYDRTDGIVNAKQYRDVYTAKIKSKSKEGPKFYTVQLQKDDQENGLEYRLVSCNSGDGTWGNVKMSGSIMTVQSAALDTALYRKHRMGMAAKDMPEYWNLPFTFFDKGRSHERSQLMTDALCMYYIENQSYFEVDRALMDQQVIFTDALKKTLDAYKAWFSVLRDSEKDVAIDNITTTEKRYHASVKALEARILAQLEQKGFKHRGYALEFKGKPFEVVAQRFSNRQTGIVYHLCISKDMPPLLVKRVLDDRDAHWLEQSSEDAFQGMPFERLGQTYTSIDDVTRRKSYTTVLIPNEGIFMADTLRKEYQKIQNAA